MTRAQIQAVYDAGPEAVIAWVQQLLDTLTQQQAAIAQLSARVQHLEARLAKDSHNSSKPPSSDAPAHKTKSQRKPTGRPPGGQPGHPGHTLRMVDTPDRTLSDCPPACVACGTPLADVLPSQVERRQVFDLPPLALEVTEHQVLTKLCPCCGEPSRGEFPAGVTQPVQYGARVKAVAVYLLAYQLIPYERVTELMSDLLAVPLCEGTLPRAIETCSAGLLGIEAAIKDGIRQARQAHFDETGLRIGGKRHWLHVSSTPRLTHYAPHAKRGRAATDAIEILPQFAGRAMHDGWRSYFGYGCLHARCNAHHLRELTFLQEQHQQAWAGKMKELLVRIYAQVLAARAAGATELAAAVLRSFEQEYEAILTEGRGANPKLETEEASVSPRKRGRKKQSAAQNMLDRLSRYRGETLAFMYDFAVPFDNNLAERDLRMMKVQQKISGGFRSSEGAGHFCRIRSYLSTMRKQAQGILTALEQVFLGHPVAPISTAG